jgi:hypothetical protein
MALGQAREACEAWQKALASFDSQQDAARIKAVQDKLAGHAPAEAP